MAARLLSALLVLVLGATGASARCGDGPNDAADVAAARAAVAAACECEAAASHADYVRCARDVARARELAGELRRDCIRTVKQCAAKSTCGRPGAVTCCTTSAKGRTRCGIKRDATRCRAPRNGTACVGLVPSCCDACAAGGCVAPSSTTTTTTTSTTSTTFAAVPCDGGFGPPICDGTCPTGQHCGRVLTPFDDQCACIPDGVTACGDAAFPTCGGTCPEGDDCIPFEHVDLVGPADFSGCFCVAPGTQCTSGPPVCTGPGACPPGKWCVAASSGGGAECGCFPL